MSFREVSCPNHFNTPNRVQVVGRNLALLLSHTYITLVDLDKMSIESDLQFGGLPAQPSCLKVSHNQVQCAAAIRTGYAALWNIGDKHFSKLQPQNCGPVNSVAFSENPARLVLGLGMYPLSERSAFAGLEFWSLEPSEPEFLQYVALPGVCVDEIIYDPLYNEYLCHCGSQSQKNGFLLRIDADTFILKEVLSTPYSWVSKMFSDSRKWDNQNNVILCSENILSFYSSEEQSVTSHKEELPSIVYGADYDRIRRLIILSTGDIYEVRDRFIKRGTFEVPPECTDVAFREDGGWVAVSKDGVLRFSDTGPLID